MALTHSRRVARRDPKGKPWLARFFQRTPGDIVRLARSRFRTHDDGESFIPIPRFALLLPLLALLLTTTPAFACLTWEHRSVTIEVEPGQEVIETAFAFDNTGDARGAKR